MKNNLGKVAKQIDKGQKINLKLKKKMKETEML